MALPVDPRLLDETPSDEARELYAVSGTDSGTDASELAATHIPEGALAAINKLRENNPANHTQPTSQVAGRIAATRFLNDKLA